MVVSLCSGSFSLSLSFLWLCAFHLVRIVSSGMLFFGVEVVELSCSMELYNFLVGISCFL